MPRLPLCLAAALLSAGAAGAHDYWLVPSSYRPAPGAETTLRLFVGDHLVPEDERPFQKAATTRYQLLVGGDALDLAGAAKDGEKPCGRFTPRAGANLVVMDRAPRLIVLEADKFNRYLADEGLDAVLADRRRLGEADRPGRERYSRCLKCLVLSGERDDGWKRQAGQRLELLPLVDPAALRPGDALAVRVDFEGKPLAGVKAFAQRRDGGKTTTVAATTTAEGVATFKLDAAGPWLVRLVHMRRLQGDADADWESVWGALTFALP